jgi:nucleoid DNA-binding protein
MGTMTKAELIERVAARKDLPRDLTKKAVAQIVDAVFTEMGDYFIRARDSRATPARFTYPGFGTFTKRCAPRASCATRRAAPPSPSRRRPRWCSRPGRS